MIFQREAAYLVQPRDPEPKKSTLPRLAADCVFVLRTDAEYFDALRTVESIAKDIEVILPPYAVGPQ